MATPMHSEAENKTQGWALDFLQEKKFYESIYQSSYSSLSIRNATVRDQPFYTPTSTTLLPAHFYPFLL